MNDNQNTAIKANGIFSVQNILAFLGIAATIIGGFWVAYVYKQNRSLSYNFTQSRIFYSPNGEFKLLYLGKEVDKVYITNILVKNSGNVPIEKPDIYDGININLGKGCQVLSSNVDNSSPPSARSQFESDLTIKGQDVVFRPTLLNDGDSVDIKIISSGCDVVTAISARIKGIKDLNKNVPIQLSPIFFLASLLLLLFTGIVSGSTRNKQKQLLQGRIESIRRQIDLVEKTNLYGDPKMQQNILNMKSHIEANKARMAKIDLSNEKKWNVVVRSTLVLALVSFILCIYFGVVS